MTRTKLTVRLPDEHLDFLKEFASTHGLTVTEVIDRYLRRLMEAPSEAAIHPEVARISGLMPAEAEGRADYYQHLEQKHR